jgi:hypothetical protein
MPVSQACQRSPLSLGRVLLRGCLVGLVATLGIHVGYTLLGPNFHSVVPGMIYRCAQPSNEALEKLVKTRGIRTVVNLRGCCDPLAWYLAECGMTNRLNVSQEDLGFSAGRLPAPAMMRQLIEVLEHSEYPILFHCHKGADRTSMASAVALLLLTETPLDEARRQVGPRFGHLPLGRTGNIDRFFDLYEEWLQDHHLTHSRDVFRQWVETDYCPGECRCALEVLEPKGEPLRLPRGKPCGVRIRCTNTSVKPWRLQPGTKAGIHASFFLHDPHDRLVGEGRAGLFYATVQSGEAIDLTLALPAMHEPGRYGLRVDMVDEQHAFFMQAGSTPLMVEVEVP